MTDAPATLLRRYMALCESFNNPLPYRWTKRDPKWYRAEFEKDGITYWVHCYPGNWDGESCWVFDFGITEASAKARGDTKTTAPTGYGNAALVLSTVKAAFDEFIAEKHPRLIIFYDSDQLSSRKRMYNLFADYLEAHWHYQRDDDLVARTARIAGNTSIWALRKGTS